LQVHDRDYPGGEADLLVLATGDTLFPKYFDADEVCGERLFDLIDDTNGGRGHLTV